MANKAGHTYSFEYQETTGVKRIARLTSTAITITAVGLGIHARDSQWQVLRYGETDFNGDFDWLTYLGTDGNVWETTVHCSAVFDASGITIDFESRRKDNHEGNNKTMRIVDWEGREWTVVVDSYVKGEGPENVGFTLS